MTETRLELEAVPNSKEFAILGFNEWSGALRIKLKAKAQDGQANEELLKKLKEVFNANARIVFGKTSRKKIIILENISQQEVLQKIKSHTKT